MSLWIKKSKQIKKIVPSLNSSSYALRMKRYKAKVQHHLRKCLEDQDQGQEKAIKETSISFTINSKPYRVSSNDVSATLSLARFIRDHAYLKGTKISCNQGGCGACVVTAKVTDETTGASKTMSVNSVSSFHAS